MGEQQRNGALQPIGASSEETKEVRFSWQHVITTGATGSGYIKLEMLQ